MSCVRTAARPSLSRPPVSAARSAAPNHPAATDPPHPPPSPDPAGRGSFICRREGRARHRTRTRDHPGGHRPPRAGSGSAARHPRPGRRPRPLCRVRARRRPRQPLCHPIRLHGRTHQADRQTGELREVYTTEDEPGRVLLVPCGNRRAAVCPACAETYRQDAYQLLRAGLAGGKGVPESASAYPAVFVTFPAPSFGPVHPVRPPRAGRLMPCQPRRHAPLCPHGVRLDCRRVHPNGDPKVGEPLCVRCYDYQSAVLWNARAPELWRYTLTYLNRELARALGISTAGLKRIARREFAKVAEYQTRGLIHFHAIIRLDAATPPGQPKQYRPPPPQLDTDLLEHAIRAAAAKAAVPVPDPDDPTATRLVRWGGQLDIRAITAASGGKVTPEQVAGYVAKYATKHTEALGPGLDHRLDAEDIAHLPRRLRPHITRLVQAAWTLGSRPHLDFLRLRPWAHQLGFGGHWSTRSRAYSTTMTALRAARRTFQHTRGGTRTPLDAWGRPETDQAVVV